MLKRRLLTVVLVVVAGGLIFALTRSGEIGPSEHEPVHRYPELWKADADTVRALREVLPFPGVIEIEGHPVKAILKDAGDDAPLALLRVIVERHAEQPQLVISPTTSLFEEAFTPSRLMEWVATRSDTDLNPALRSIATDREGFIKLRAEAMAAAAWAGNVGMIAPLTTIALDEEENRDLRVLSLLLLARFERPLPPELRSLLSSRIDFVAAYALAKSGDETAYPRIREARQVLADDAIAMELLSEIEVPRSTTTAVPAKVQRLEADDVRKASNPDLLEAVLAIRDVPRERRDAYHRRLDRLVKTIAKDFGNEQDPERIIAVLNRNLLANSLASGTNSFLPEVLAGFDGNCLGTCSLYLAVAARLNLPIHPVFAPEHVFLRWESPGYRRNIEVTDGGINLDDDFYANGASERLISDRSKQQGVYLRRVDTREFLAAVFSNHAGSMNAEGHFLRARASAERALELNPTLVTALAQKALAIFHGGPGQEDVALDACAAAIDVNNLELGPRKLRVEILLDLEDFEHALTECEQILDIHPEHVETRMDQATCLLRLGRLPEALAVIEAIDPGLNTFFEQRCKRLRVAHFVLNRDFLQPCDYKQMINSLVTDESTLREYTAELYCTAAEAFLITVGSVSSEPARALEILDEVRSTGPTWHRTRIRALLMSGQAEAARAEFADYYEKRNSAGSRESRKLRLELDR